MVTRASGGARVIPLGRDEAALSALRLRLLTNAIRAHVAARVNSVCPFCRSGLRHLTDCWLANKTWPVELLRVRVVVEGQTP